MRIPATEYQDRLTRLQASVAASDVDACLLASRESIFYLTGVSYEPLERPFLMLVRPSGPLRLLAPVMEQVHLQESAPQALVSTYREYPAPPGEGWPDQLAALLGDCARLAIEPSLPQEIADGLQGREAHVLPLVENLRCIKSPAEVAMIRLAARYADRAVERVIRASYYGVAEIELFAQGRTVLTEIMREVGFDVLTTTVLAGAWPAPDSAQPHSVPTIADRLTEGPHIALCLDRVFGYAAECERTYFTALPSSDVRAAFTAMMEARRRAYALLRPGTPCAEVDTAATDFLRTEGYGDYLLHRTGHGFGLGNHERPWLAAGSTETLQANMVVSNEPGIYLPGVGGIRHSDTILITADGYENLTRYPVDLADLTIRGRKPLSRLRGALVRRAVGLGGR